MKAMSLAFILLALFPVTSANAQKDTTVNDDDVKATGFEELRYPLTARLLHVEGVVVVRVVLDNNGIVIDSVALSGAKPLVADSLANATKWRFRVGPQKTAIIVYRFRIDPGLCYGVAPSAFVFYPPNFVTVTSCESVAVP